MTTKAKAKEAARMAEKLITLAKHDTPTTRRLAQGVLYVRLAHIGHRRKLMADRSRILIYISPSSSVS